MNLQELKDIFNKEMGWSPKMEQDDFETWTDEFICFLVEHINTLTKRNKKLTSELVKHLNNMIKWEKELRGK